MSNKLSLPLGGQERELEFETLGFLDHLGEITKIDPLDLFSDGFATDPGKAYKVNFAVIYAGLLADCDEKNVTPTFTKEEVTKWVRNVPIKKVEGLVLNAYVAMTGKTVDELKKVIAQAASQNGSILAEV